jgi:hypothetical protein
VRRLALVLGVMVAVMLSGAAAASMVAGSASPNPPGGRSPNEGSVGAGDAGIHGGPIERFHRGSPCDLTNVSALPGNWTHGDYVAAVADAGDPVLIQRAAQSGCGKPMVAVNWGGGPPAHALAKMAAVHSNAEAASRGEAGETSGPPGS